MASVITAGLPELLDDLERQAGLAEPAEGLADDEVDARVDRPADLLLERLAHAAHGLGIVGLVGVGVGEITREQGAALVRHLLRDLQRLAIERLEDVLLADDLELLAVAVIGERLDHVGAGAHELAVELAHRLGRVEHDLRHVRPGLEVAAPLQLEQIALGADHRPLGQPLQQSFPGHRALPCLTWAEGWARGRSDVNRRHTF